MLHRVAAKLFALRRSDAAPSTQFAPTMVAMPEPAPSPAAVGLPDSLSPESQARDSQASDSQATDSSGAFGAAPDIVTDLAGLPAEAPDPSADPTLSHIGRYALKRQLGAGGLGTVFEAWDPLLSRAVAVKTLQLDVEQQVRASLDGLFLNEARAAAGLNHRCIVTIFDAGLSPHGVYIAMERLYGRDLQRAVAEGWRPSVEQTVLLVRRIAEALAYAHARGVVHCDIKPANIFLQRRDRPKVLDFGIARILHGADLPALDGALVGSPRYRAPEQLLPGGKVDARTDLFSLGVVMYELLAGRRAFGGETLAEINQAVLETDPPPAHTVEPRVPPEVSAIVSRLMSRDPAARHTCAGELVAELRRWSAGPSAAQPASRTAAGPLPTAATASASLRRPLVRWLLAGSLLAAAAAAYTAYSVYGTRMPTTRAPPAALSVVPVVPVAPPAAMQMATEGEPAIAAAAPAPPPAPSSTPPADAPDKRRSTASATLPTRGIGATRRVVARDIPQGQAQPVEEPSPAQAAPVSAAPAAEGLVLLAVSPWAEVEVDGRSQGTAPPLSRLALSEGSHRITLRNADFAPMTVQVEVSADKPVTLRHRFGS